MKAGVWQGPGQIDLAEVDDSRVQQRTDTLPQLVEAHRLLDARGPGWIKVALEPVT